MSDKSNKEPEDKNDDTPNNNGSSSVIHLQHMYRNWFLDYASYVILERAVPALEDGLKPVQRRIFHSMRELEDGRYNKVANVIGNTMKYHPHGDASIGDAMVQLGQKELAIDTQGNWGNILTGDSAAAPRYIEARLSKFALDVIFNEKTTVWQNSYDGRNKEPVYLPVKFPLLLAQGAEGIAVGLACKILPHNFNELIDASIGVLKGKKPHIYPDFPSGGMADFSNYNDGMKGGKVIVRAKINILDKKTLVITEIPFGCTTSSLIDSIVTANEKGKIKIRNIEDNTAENVEIVIHLPAGFSPDKTIDALYAFTDCAVSISPNACVIEGDKPRFMGVGEMLRVSAERTQGLLQNELDIRMAELTEQFHYVSLEKIFIEKRIYREIEESETWEDVLTTIEEGLKPYRKKLPREITRADVIKLTEIKIKRISKYDAFQADELMKHIQEEIKTVKHHQDNIVDYTIDYFKEIKKKYGAGKERKTEIKAFDTIVATAVAATNQKLYVNREEGFAGFKMRTDEFVCDCSDLDDIIVMRRDGTMLVTKISEKTFVGKDVLYINVFKRNDERTIYNLIYRDGARGNTMIKRFAVTSVIRDKDYMLTRGNPNSEVLYLSANPNGEAEVVTVFLKANATARNKVFDADFAELAIKGRDAMGNILTKHPVRKVTIKEKGVSTLTAQKIWYDDTVQRLNAEEHGRYLGEFEGDDKIMVITKDGNYHTCGFEFTTHFDADSVLIEKLNKEKPLSVVYWEADKKKYYIKRFLPEESEKKTLIISEYTGSLLESVSYDEFLVAEIKFRQEKGKELPDEILNVASDIPVMGMKAQGKPINLNKVKEIQLKPDPNQPVGDLVALAAIEEKMNDEMEESGKSPIEIAKEHNKIKLPEVLPEKKPSKPRKPRPKEDDQPTLF